MFFYNLHLSPISPLSHVKIGDWDVTQLVPSPGPFQIRGWRFTNSTVSVCPPHDTILIRPRDFRFNLFSRRSVWYSTYSTCTLVQAGTVCDLPFAIYCRRINNLIYVPVPVLYCNVREISVWWEEKSNRSISSILLSDIILNGLFQDRLAEE